MNEDIRNFIFSILGLGGRSARRAGMNVRAGYRLIFWGSLFFSALLIVLGVAASQKWMVNTSTFFALVVLLIALFAINGANWAILLIMKDTRKQTGEILKNVIAPAIFWYAVVNFVALLVPIEKVTVMHLVFLVAAVMITSLGTYLTNSTAQATIKSFIFLASMVLFWLVIDVFFPTFSVSIKANLITPGLTWFERLAMKGAAGAGASLLILVSVGMILIALSSGEKMGRAISWAIVLGGIATYLVLYHVPNHVLKQNVVSNSSSFPVSTPKLPPPARGDRITLPDPAKHPGDYYNRGGYKVFRHYDLAVSAGDVVTSTDQRVWFRYEYGRKVYQRRFADVDGKLKITQDGAVYFLRESGGGVLTTVIVVDYKK